jgi:uncharacterized protein YxjI
MMRLRKTAMYHSNLMQQEDMKAHTDFFSPKWFILRDSYTLIVNETKTVSLDIGKCIE